MFHYLKKSDLDNSIITVLSSTPLRVNPDLFGDDCIGYEGDLEELKLELESKLAPIPNVAPEPSEEEIEPIEPVVEKPKRGRKPKVAEEPITMAMAEVVELSSDEERRVSRIIKRKFRKLR